MAYEPGKYRGRITDYGVTQSQAGQQHPTVFITFELIGQYDPTSGELMPCDETATRSYFKSVTRRTADWLAADLKAIGYDRPGLEYLDPETPGAVNLFDHEIDVDCQHESYEGQTRERWSIHRERTRKKLGRDELAQLDAMFGDQFRRVLGAGNAEAVPPPVTANQDDNLF
jgi:hypothetical protein